MRHRKRKGNQSHLLALFTWFGACWEQTQAIYRSKLFEIIPVDLDESLIVLQSNTMCSSFMDTSIHVFHSFDVLDWMFGWIEWRYHMLLWLWQWASPPLTRMRYETYNGFQFDRTEDDLPSYIAKSQFPSIGHRFHHGRKRLWWRWKLIIQVNVAQVYWLCILAFCL